jgi:hypothetical protein
VGDPDELREAGADEVVPTVAAWVDGLVARVELRRAAP